MISFTCDQCGKTFKVPPAFAGRTARCKACGNVLTVPGHLPEVELDLREAESSPSPQNAQAQALTATVAPPIKIPMRTRRLRADAEAMLKGFQNSPMIQVTPLAGDPPETYRITYHIESLQPDPDKLTVDADMPDTDAKPIPRTEHEVEIQLTSDYPRLSPSCKILTPIFHPNFDAGTICVGDHWTAGERLVDLVVRIGEMIAYQAYNIQSPLNGQAAMWADLNRGLLPTDQRSLHPAELD